VRLAPRLRAALVWLAMPEGSTRPAALMRLAFAMLAWARWAYPLHLYADLSPQRMAVAVSFFLSTTLMFFGVLSRASTAWAGLTTFFMYYAWGIVPGNESWHHHHHYLLSVSMCLLALAPCGRSYSLDRVWAARRAARTGRPLPDERGPLWAVRLIGLQLCVLYFWTAFNKSKVAFLSGERLQQIYMHSFAGSDMPAWSGFRPLTMAVAVAVVALEYALAFGLFVPRLRRVLLPLGILFHGVLYVLLPIATFSLTCWAIYLAYLDPEAVHRWTSDGVGPGAGAPCAAPEA
jgi:Vitamin K-dependent gamma-carboxylase